MLRRLLPAAVLLAVVLAACGGTSAPAITDPAEIIGQGLEATADATSFHLDLTVTGNVTIPDTGYRPNASTSYSIKRMAGGKTLVRSTDWTTQDQIEGCDSLQFSDGIKTIANIPVVTETALTIPLPYTTNKVIRQLKASGSPTTWSITNGNANGYFAIDTSGNLTLTAAGVAAISPTLVPSYSMGGSFTGSASPGSAFRVYFSSTGYVGRGTVFVDGNTINTTQVSVRIATASSHTSGTLDSVWIGKVAAGVPNQLPNFEPARLCRQLLPATSLPCGWGQYLHFRPDYLQRRPQ